MLRVSVSSSQQKLKYFTSPVNFFQDYSKNIIKKHELTRQDKEIDRTNLINIQNANAEPILFTYHDVQAINNILESTVEAKPFIDIVTEDDKAIHKIWQLSTNQSKFIQEQFSKEVQSFYIADGHHRMAASFNVAKQRRQQAQNQGLALTGEEPFEYVFALAISLKNLHIMPYNRVINSFNGVSEEQILQKIEKSFYVEKASKEDTIVPKKKGEWSILIKNEWYKLRVKEEEKKKVLGATPTKADQLDVNLLQILMIEPIFGIKNIRTDKNIEFVGGVTPKLSLEEKYFNEKKACSILCHPISIQELLEISDHNQIMMPKSTWVIPKPRSGLIVRIF